MLSETHADQFGHCVVTRLQGRADGEAERGQEGTLASSGESGVGQQRGDSSSHISTQITRTQPEERTYCCECGAGNNNRTNSNNDCQ